MTTKKLSLIITSLTLLICILFSGVLYSISKEVVSDNFQRDVTSVEKNISTEAFDKKNNGETITPNEYAKILCKNRIIWSPYSNKLQYPFTFSIFDSKGNIVEKYGYYILTDDDYINIDDYMTNDIIEKFKNTFGNPAVGVTIDKFSYYIKDGKKIVTTISFYDYNTEKTLDITLNNYKGKTITKTNVGRFDEEDSVSIDFDFSKMYQNKANKKLQKEMDKLISNQYQLSEKELNGNNGYIAHEISAQSYTFGKTDNKYTAYYIYKYNEPYCTTQSNIFRSGIDFLVIIFVSMSVILSIIACKIFKKQQELNEAKQAFTSGAAHELKTPITIINNQCECLIKNVSPEKNPDYISAIYRQNKHMSNLVSKLLQYNRINQESISKTKFDIKELASEEIEKYKMLADEHDIIVETNLNSKFIFADRDLTSLVIDNFLSNAIKNTKNGDKIKIEFAGKRFSVFNEGSQIDSKDGRKIWEAFTKGADNDVIESHGMGLAICKKILDLHKFKYGYINKNSGVEFYFEVK